VAGNGKLFYQGQHTWFLYNQMQFKLFKSRDSVAQRNLYTKYLFSYICAPIVNSI